MEAETRAPPVIAGRPAQIWQPVPPHFCSENVLQDKTFVRPQLLKETAYAHVDEVLLTTVCMVNYLQAFAEHAAGQGPVR